MAAKTYHIVDLQVHCKVCLTDQIKELRRELSMRKQVYPGLINSGKLDRAEANRQYKALEATLKIISQIHALQTGKQSALTI